MDFRRLLGVGLVTVGVGSFTVALVGIAGASDRAEPDPAVEPVVAQAATAETKPLTLATSVPEGEAEKLRELALRSDVAHDLVGEAMRAATAGEVGPWHDDNGALLGHGVLISLVAPITIDAEAALGARLPGAYENVTEIAVFIGGDGTTLNVSVVNGTLDPKAAAELERIRPDELPE